MDDAEKLQRLAELILIIADYLWQRPIALLSLVLIVLIIAIMIARKVIAERYRF